MRTPLILAAVLLALPVSGAQGQDGSTAPGIQFAGCWAPLADGIAGAVPRTCVAPVAGDLRFTTIAADGELTESTLHLDGQRHDVRTEGCAGWEQARLSDDRERLLIDAELTCERNAPQRRATAWAISPEGLWVQVAGSGIAMIGRAQVGVLAPVESYLTIPAAPREAVLPYLGAAERARLQMRSNRLSAADLVELERLDVAPSLIDVLVAVSYPRAFVIDAVNGNVAGAVAERGQVADARTGPSYLDPWFFGGYFPMLSAYDWQMLSSCMRYSSLACRYGNAWGYGGYGYYGYPYGGGYWPGPGTVVVVRPAPTDPAEPRTGGRAVRGRGYTQDGGTGGGTAQPRAVDMGAGGGAASSHSGGSGGGGAGSSGGGASSGGSARTAKPRSP